MTSRRPESITAATQTREGDAMWSGEMVKLQAIDLRLSS